MGSPSPKKLKAAIGCAAVVGLVIGGLALLCLAYSTHKLVHAVEHYNAWNATVNGPDASCDPSRGCCDCDRADYGHCCKPIEQDDADAKPKLCLLEVCEPRMSYHWCHYVVIIVSVIVLAAVVFFAALGLLSLCVSGAARILRCLCAPCLAKCLLDNTKEHLGGAAQELQELKKDVEDNTTNDDAVANKQ